MFTMPFNYCSNETDKQTQQTIAVLNICKNYSQFSNQACMVMVYWDISIAKNSAN